MSTQLQLRRGTTAQHSTFTGASGEITIDTDKKTVVVHDGTTAGGRALPQFDASGNLGIGVTPSAWVGRPAIEMSNSGAAYLINNGTGAVVLGTNHYYTGTQNTYKNNGYATEYATYSGNHAWFTAPSGTAGNAITFTQAMTLDSSGNLGIGTASPSQTLHVRKAADGVIYLDSSTPGYGKFFAQSGLGAVYLGSLDTLPLTFYTNATERMRIDSSGNLGLGVTPSAWNSAAALEIGAAGNALWGYAGGGLRVIQNARYNAGSWLYTSTAAASRYDQGSGIHSWYTAPSGTAGNPITFTQAMTLDSSGQLFLPQIPSSASSANLLISLANNGIYYSTSALKYKQDVRDIEYIDINKIRPVRYKSKCEADDQSIDYFGVIADEVHANGITELVTYGKDNEVEGFQYERLTVVLLKALQEAVARIDSQAQTIESLTQRIEALEYTKQGE